MRGGTVNPPHLTTPDYLYILLKLGSSIALKYWYESMLMWGDIVLIKHTFLAYRVEDSAFEVHFLEHIPFWFAEIYQVNSSANWDHYKVSSFCVNEYSDCFMGCGIV